MTDRDDLLAALAPFAAVAERDIGQDEGDTDLFRPMSARHARAPLLTVGDFRRAQATLAHAREAGAQEPVAFVDMQFITKRRADFEREGVVAYAHPAGTYRTPVYTHPAPAQEPVAVPAGFVLVPERLTPEIKAVMKRCEAGELSMAEAWSAMLAASLVPALDGEEVANPDWLPFAAQWGGYALLLQARRLCAEIEKLPGGLDQSAMIDRASEVAFALQQFQMRGEYHWRPIPAPVSPAA